MDERASEKSPAAWVFLNPAAVPDRWAARAVPMAMVALTAEESLRLLDDAPVEQDPLAQDADLMRLVARGLSAEVIARRLGIAPRSVYRRLARLRGAFGAASTVELATELARRGFGVTDPTADGTGGTVSAQENNAGNKEVS